MVVCATDHNLQADVMLVIEATAVNGAYINDLKSHYIIPALDYFNQGNVDEASLTENSNSLYGIVLYYAADCLPGPSSDTLGPCSSTTKILSTLERLELIGGKSESHANIAEGLATALLCFEELQQKRESRESRDTTTTVQKHCILICNSPPYLLPVMECHNFAGKTAEQLAGVLQERGIHLSIISPRKIPMLYKLFEKAGGDLTTSQTKNYAKDPRHLVLLKGFSLKERPISPAAGGVSSSQQNPLTASIPLTSLPSPLPNTDSPISAGAVVQQSQGLMQNATPGGPANQNPVFRGNNPQGIAQLPQHPQAMVSPAGMVNVGMVNTGRGGLMGSNQFGQTMQNPPLYQTSGAAMGGRGATRWIIPQQRSPYMPQPGGPQQPQGQVSTTQGSALIAQLTQPPSSMPNPVNQFNQMGGNSPLTPQQQQQQQQQQLRLGLMNQQQNVVGGPMGQNPPPGGMQASSSNQGTPPNQGIPSQSQTQQPNQQITPGRQTIWSGLLEWMEKKVPTDPQKVHVPCSVSANAKDGEPELKADGWPSKLIMQLMPKQLIGNIGGAYLKNSKSVLFHPTPCEALDSLTKVMGSGFAGCVHFTSIANPPTCDIKVLILLYTAEKRAYLGFIPNDQVAFVDRLRKVIQQQKSSQMMRQGGAPGQQGPQMGPGGQMNVAGAAPSSQPQGGPTGGMMMTNTMAMGGGQITQNVVSSTGQGSQGGQGGMLAQNVNQRIRMPGLQQQQQQQPGQQQQQQQGQQGQQQAQSGNTGGAAGGSGGMMAGPPGGVQRPGQPFANQLEVERQANLDKINQLKQTLEAAQQQEQQYKNQLERISHMKTAQLQEALQLAQQQEMQYKILDQQQRLAQVNPPPAIAAQQRSIMRPGVANNPGLRSLLQQQPQYRQQIMNMQHQMTGGGVPRPQHQIGQQQIQGGGAGAGGNQQAYDDNYDFM